MRLTMRLAELSYHSQNKNSRSTLWCTDIMDRQEEKEERRAALLLRGAVKPKPKLVSERRKHCVHHDSR